MKRLTFWVPVAAGVVFVVDWGIMGLKLMDGDYDILASAYVGIGCVLIMLVCAVCKLAQSKCPHCGKPRLSAGEYCPYCGKKSWAER